MERKQIVVNIIGAGISGLSTALNLLKLSKESKQEFQINIIEARDRIGGRLHTFVHPSGSVADLGASFIHGHVENPITLLAEKYGLALTKPQESSEPEISSVYDENGVEFDPEICDDFSDAFSDWIFEIYKKGENLENDISLKDLLSQSNPLDFLNKCCSDLEIDLKTAQKLYDLEISSVEGFNGAEIADISAKYSNGYQEFPGGDRRIIGGYQQLVHGILQELGSHVTFKLNHIVSQVEYKNKQSIIRGKVLENSFEIIGDCTVISVPLGVLKSSSIQFQPELPSFKLKSIEVMGYGHLEKVVLVFSDSFWDINCEWIGCYDNIPHYFNQKFKANDNILIGFYCNNVKEMTSLTDEELVEISVKSLEKKYGKVVREKLVGSTVTRWVKDPFSNGSYSYMKLGATPQDFEDLGKPVEEQRLFFVGEATVFKLWVRACWLFER